MNILMIGTGVIGCIYGWQLSETKNKVTHFVRKGASEQILKNGVFIHCFDARKQKNRFIETIYKPDVIEEINAESNEYDLIIVPVKANQLESILPLLAKTKAHSPILFLQNLWVHHVESIKNALPDSKVLYGQAHIAGGGKKGNVITCTIFGNKKAPTMIGTEDGTRSKELLLVNELMKKADLNPKISKHILDWLFTHYVEANGLVAGVMEAGTAEKYGSTKEYVKHSVQLVREGLKVCSLLGIKTWKIYPQAFYYAPMWLLAPFLLKMYRSKESQLMIQEHISHAPDEMKEMFCDVLLTGNQFNLAMNRYRKIQECVLQFAV